MASEVQLTLSARELEVLALSLNNRQHVLGESVRVTGTDKKQSEVSALLEKIRYAQSESA